MSEIDEAIRRVWQNSSNKQLLITVPKDLAKPGQYLRLTKVKF